MSCWDLPEVAEAQYDLTCGELEAFRKGRVFTYFAMALTYVPGFEELSLVDLGCGVGHYATFIHQQWPEMLYTGIDASQAMVDVAQEHCKNPRAEFFCFSLDNYDYPSKFYQIALHSQALEYTPHPAENLAHLLRQGPRYIILHKIRFTEDRSAPSHRLMELTYCGHQEEVYLWNEFELLKMIEDCPRTRRIWRWIPWAGENIATWLIS